VEKFDRSLTAQNTKKTTYCAASEVKKYCKYECNMNSEGVCATVVRAAVEHTPASQDGATIDNAFTGHGN